MEKLVFVSFYPMIGEPQFYFFQKREQSKIFGVFFQTEYGTKVFDYAANICYNFLGARKRYNRYLENLKLTHVPSLRETILASKPNEARQTSTTVSSGAQLQVFAIL